jgi:hypothetical protein
LNSKAQNTSVPHLHDAAEPAKTADFVRAKRRLKKFQRELVEAILAEDHDLADNRLVQIDNMVFGRKQKLPHPGLKR